MKVINGKTSEISYTCGLYCYMCFTLSTKQVFAVDMIIVITIIQKILVFCMAMNNFKENNHYLFRQARLTAYRQFISWMMKGEKLGKGKRVIIPSCVVTAIRTRFPDSNNDYTGFRTVLDGIRDLFQ